MKYFFLAILIASSLSSFSQRSIDVSAYDFFIEVSDRNDSIFGKAYIQVGVTNSTKDISLDLVNSNGKKGMTVQSVRFNGEAIKFTHSNDKLTINPGIDFKETGTVSLQVDYSGIPADGLIISKNKFGKRTFFSDNWPNRAHHWIPCVDEPGDKASVSFTVQAPATYSVVSNGLKQTDSLIAGQQRITKWEETVELPTKVMVIGIADFAVSTPLDANGVPVTSWVYKDNEIQGFGDYLEASDVLKWYMEYIGPYPYKKLANVQSKTIFGGMENASAIFYFENSVNGKKAQEALIAHEIVHQWFGNSATEASFPHLWLSEGFATYLTHVFIGKKYGEDSLRARMEKDRGDIVAFSKDSDKPVVDSLSPLMNLLNPNSYEKGGWVLHMLRMELGDSLFQQTIRAYYLKYAGKNATTEDFRAVVEKVRGLELKTFFHQWLYVAGHPRLNVGWKQQGKVVTITVEQLQDNLFDFPMEFAINGDLHRFRVNKLKQEFRVDVKTERAGVVLDPGVKLLWERG